MAGITPQGFDIKPLTEITDEINAGLVAALGAGFSTALDTPQGQIVNVIADAHSVLWELAQNLYGSFDMRQATGSRLDQLAVLRGLVRVPQESDSAFRARLLSATNSNRANVDNIAAAVRAVPGVTDVKIHFNDTGLASTKGLPLTATIQVTGGDDDAIAQAINDDMVFGLALLGNTTVNLDSNGQCNTVRFSRINMFPFTLQLEVSDASTVGVCTTTKGDIAALLKAAFDGPLNKPGVDVTIRLIESILIAGGIDVRDVKIENRDIGFTGVDDAIATLAVDDVTVTFV